MRIGAGFPALKEGENFEPKVLEGASKSVLLMKIPPAGLEPARPKGQWILNPQRLPFRHGGFFRGKGGEIGGSLRVRRACFRPE